ncbi:RING finger protein 112-like isoform X2 [Mytilus trossulus]|uniref:RING finger protein 112-like isoform X2 n=1 Tax=Mytilus trossulus TaxID=6551 RepID=UPI00300714DC
MTTCSICLEHLEKPMCCIPCGHLYCNRCISAWRNRHNDRCPECREPFSEIQSIRLDTESIRELFDERTRLNDSVNELTKTIENLRQNPSNEELKRAINRKRSTPTAKDNSVVRFATIIFLIFASVCFLYLGVCIFAEWFSEKPEMLDDIVVRHLEFLSGSSTYITSTFLSAATYVDYFYGTYTQTGELG